MAEYTKDEILYEKQKEAYIEERRIILEAAASRLNKTETAEDKCEL